jgi:hypothetical protein
MTAKKRSAKKLKAAVKKLRAKLDRAELRGDRWKRKAVRLDKTTTALEAKVKKLKKRNKALEKASRAAASRPTDPIGPSIMTEVPTSVLADSTPDRSPEGEPELMVGPDASWTVAQLRAEARSRGLTGLSGKTKAQLLTALE